VQMSLSAFAFFMVMSVLLMVVISFF
jgi:hypothetical protein